MDYGKRGGTSANAGKRAVSYSCPHPVTGALHLKCIFKPPFAKPLALWYRHNGTWYLNTLVDLDTIPTWAEKYSKHPAEFVDRPE
jgi:hypothetical protein